MRKKNKVRSYLITIMLAVIIGVFGFGVSFGFGFSSLLFFLVGLIFIIIGFWLLAYSIKGYMKGEFDEIRGNRALYLRKVRKEDSKFTKVFALIGNTLFSLLFILFGAALLYLSFTKI